jgi:hypothetical protein
VDSFKSIAVPVTRKRVPGKPRKAGHPAVPAGPLVGGTVGPGRRTASPAAAQAGHRFHVGERLIVNDGGRSLQRLRTMCRVIALLPVEGGPPRYRVRSEAESFERVVDEADLSRER